MLSSQFSPFSLPLTFEHRSSRSASLILMLLLLVPAAGSVLVLAMLVATNASDVMIAAQDHPVGAVQVALGILFWTLLFVLPAIVLACRFGRDRTVSISRTHVTIQVRSPFGNSEVVERLETYDGLVHVVRTSISAVRHELLLVQRETGRRVVFHVADRIGRETIDQAGRLLGLPEISAADLINLNLRLPRPFEAAAPVPAI